MTLGTKPSRLVASLAVVGSAAAAFLVAAPYTILDLPAFLNGYAHLAGYYAPKRLAEPAWLTYYKHLSRSMDWPAFLLLLGGLGLGAVRAVRGPGRVRWTVTIAFPLLYFYFLSGQTLVFGRYLLAAPPLRLRAGRRRHRVRGQPAAPLRHPARAAHGRDRRAHRCRAPATRVAIARLHPDDRADEHGRAGPHVDPLGRPQGLVDRHRDAGAPRCRTRPTRRRTSRSSSSTPGRRPTTTATSRPGSTTSSRPRRNTAMRSAGRRTIRSSTTPTRGSLDRARK